MQLREVILPEEQKDLRPGKSAAEGIHGVDGEARALALQLEGVDGKKGLHPGGFSQHL
jgi:hypothetical protein